MIQGVKFGDTFAYTALVVLLITMAAIAFFSMREDSLTFDEMSHIPDGYSYLVKHDYRLNPEHPPLVKDLAAIPLLFMGLNFPSQSPNWTTWTPDQQWRFGPEFLYRSGNNPDRIVFWARIPMLGFLVALGITIFKWAKKLGGNKAALFAFALFAFSPAFVAHGRLVTTDVAAALGFLISSYWFFLYLEKPSMKNLVLTGIVWGASLLLKFTIIITLPFFAAVWLMGAIALKSRQGKPNGYLIGARRTVMRDIPRLMMLGVVALALIGIIYGFHTSGYPPQEQKLHTEYTVRMYNDNPSSNPIYRTLIWMSDKPVLRAYEQYLLGITMNYKRSTFGNTTFFRGEISAAGWRRYFPVVYAIKEPLPLHILSAIALMLLVSRFAASLKKKRKLERMAAFLSSHLVPVSFFIFIVIYWALSIRSNLNIGVRHVLPTFPFIYILLAVSIGAWINEGMPAAPRLFQTILRHPFITLLKYGLLFFLLFWYIAGTIKAYPSYISYFNELVGGGENGHRYVVDSNLDWGQDFRRLKSWIEKNEVSRLHLDYFGGADAEYYLGEVFIPWWSDLGPPKGYFAVSLTKLKGAQAKPVEGFTLRPEERYEWLRNKEPVAKIGHSIWVYHFNETTDNSNELYTNK